MAQFNQIVLNHDTVDHTFLPRRLDSNLAVYVASAASGIPEHQDTLTVANSRTQTSETRSLNFTLPAIRTTDGTDTAIGANFLKISAKTLRLATADERQRLLSHARDILNNPEFEKVFVSGEWFFG